jgi:hypothetical protein
MNERRALALLLAAIFLGTPFSWACTILFLFPLFEEYATSGFITTPAWALALVFALAQKAILPPALWEVTSHASLHAWCLAALTLLAVARVVRATTKLTFVPPPPEKRYRILFRDAVPLKQH